jgi:hypothetical protein
MPDEDEPVADRLLQLLQGIRLPEAVETAWTSPPLVPRPGQLWRAVNDDVARFVLVLVAGDGMIDVAPVTLDVERTTDEAYIAEAGLSDLEVPVAVWLRLRRPVERLVLDRYVGNVRVAVDEIRNLPTGPPVTSVLEDRAMERAVLADDMDELSAASAARATLVEILAKVPLPEMQAAGFPVPLALQLRRGLRAVSEEQAERLAPLAGVSAATLLAANPPLPADLVRYLDSDVGRSFVEQYLEARGGETRLARLAVGYGAYALAARETDRDEIDWLARIQRYVQAVLSGS